MKIKKLALSLILAFGVSASALAQTFPNASWKYSVPLTIASGATVNSTVKVDVDFASLLTRLGVNGTLDFNSIRVVRPNGTLVNIQEFNDNIYNGTTDTTGRARGQVAFILQDAGPSTYQIYFDITANGTKATNPQTPINGGFEKGTTGQEQPLGWNAPTVPNNYDAEVRPNESPRVVTRTQNGTLNDTVDGSPYTGAYSYLIGDRSETTNAGVGGGTVTITKTMTIPTNPGNLSFKYRIEGWDSSSFDYFRVQIVANTTATIVGPNAVNRYTVYPYSPNYGGAVAGSSNSGYGQYNAWDWDTGNRHRPQDSNATMTIAKGAEPWFTVNYSLAAFAGRTVTLSFSTTHQQLYKTWVNIDDVEWSVIGGTLGTPIAYNTSVNAANFECLETGTNTPFNKASRDPLYTKITNTPFSFDIVALDSSGAVETDYVAGSTNKSVTVELFDASTTKSCAAYTSPIATTTATFTSSSNGRVTIPNLTSTSAYSKLICRVKDSNPSTAVYGCSSDSFSIRPQNISSISSNANADTNGVSETNTPTVVAGNNFTVTANTGVIGYNGTPKVNLSATEWLNAPSYGISQAAGNGTGTLLGGFSNSASSNTGNGANGVFNYSEAGYFRFKSQAIYDNDFISNSADDTNNDCIVGSYSNTLVNGRYGCNFGTTSASPYIGRFIPAAFVVSSNALINRSNLSCSTVSPFTYLGEPFDLSVGVKPVNTLGQTTMNYARNRFNTTSLTSWNLNISNGLLSRLNVTNYNSAWNSLGILNTAVTTNITRNALPDGAFNNTVVSINPKDNDNVSLLTNALDVDIDSNGVLDSKNIGTTNFYFGRMKINNTTGSELLKMTIPIEVQYFNGTGFVTNINYSCTTLTGTSFSTNNFTQYLTAQEVSLVYPTRFINGKQTIIMNKPSGGDGLYSGSFDLNYNLNTSGQIYLLGKSNTSSYNANPKAKIILARKQNNNNNKIIFIKDNF